MEYTRRNFLTFGTTTLLGGTLLSACNNQQQAGKTNYTIAFVTGLAGAAFFETIRLGGQEEAKAQMVALKFQAPKDYSALEQINIVEALLAQKPDGLVIAPNDAHMLLPSLQKCHDAGIPVVTVDSSIGDGNYRNGNVTFPISYIGSDNEQSGYIAGRTLIKALAGKGNIYVQDASSGASTLHERELGFEKAIAETRGTVKIISTNYDGGDQNKATVQTMAALQSLPIGGIFGANIFSAAGAVQAVKNLNKQGWIQFAYFDAWPPAIVDLRDGLVNFVISQDPYSMGRLAVRTIVRFLQGETVEKRIVTKNMVITRDTVDTPQAQAVIYRTS